MLAGSVASPVAGQSTLLKPARELTVTVETSGASFRDTDYDALGLVGVVALPFKPRLTVVAGGAFSYAWADGVASSLMISNIFASVQLGTGGGGYGTITITLPTTGRLTNQAYAADAGFLLDTETPERFTPKALGVAASVTPLIRLGQATVIGARLGLATVSPSGIESDFYGRYAAFADRNVGLWDLGVDLTGAVALRSRADSFADKSLHHLTVRAGFQSSLISPTIVVRIPADDQASDAVRWVIGIRASVVIPGMFSVPLPLETTAR